VTEKARLFLFCSLVESLGGKRIGFGTRNRMSALSQISSSHWKTATLLGAVIFLSSIYFYEGGGWNQNSRFDLLRAIVEQHTLRIDTYHENTQDKAHFRGHYYSDKAPGLVFLAVPFALAARPGLRVARIDPASARGEFWLSYLVTAWAVALPTALAGVCLYFLALRFGGSAIGAAFGVIVLALGTPLWAYASLFWAHALVGACLLFAFAAALKVGDGERDFVWALAVGLAAGWATVTEYPAAPASAMLALLALSQAWPRGLAARWRVAAGVGIGAGICVMVLLSYLYAAFGGFRPSYSYYDPNSFSFMQQQGYMGLTYPHPDRLLKLLFGCARGLFFASPVLLAAPVGLRWLWKQKRFSAPALAAAAIVAYYFLFNASFYWWKAGLTFGPRYAGAAIPLLCLGLALSWDRASIGGRRVMMWLGAISICLTLMVVSTTSQLAMQDSCPIVHSTWSAFWSGQMAINRDSMLTAAEATGRYGAFNLGQLMGLHGLASLISLLGMWGIAALVWWRIRLRA
jgi:4-amino-4-deoxy-L-arabinose transferase-like glycosyltransferase